MKIMRYKETLFATIFLTPWRVGLDLICLKIRMYITLLKMSVRPSGANQKAYSYSDFKVHLI